MPENKKIIELIKKSSLSTGEASTSYIPFTYNGIDYRIAANVLVPYFGSALKVTGIYSDIQLIYSSSPRQVTLNNIDTGDISYHINGTQYTIANNQIASINDVTKNYALILTSDSTFEAVADSNMMQLSGVDFLIVGIVNAQTGLWTTNGTFTSLKTQQPIIFSKIIQTGQSDSITTSNIIYPPANGNYVNISDNTEEVQLIANVDSEGKAIQGGTSYKFDFKEGTVIKHLYSPSGDGKRIRLDCMQKYTTTRDILLEATYDSEDDWWEISGTTSGDTALSNEIYIEKAVAYGREVSSTTFVDLNDIELDGTEQVLIGDESLEGIQDSYVSLDFDNNTVLFDGLSSTASAYNLRILDSDGNVKYRFPLAERPRDTTDDTPRLDISDIFDVITGSRAFLIGWTENVEIEDYFYNHENSFQIIMYGDYEYLCPLMEDGTEIFETT